MGGGLGAQFNIEGQARRLIDNTREQFAPLPLGAAGLFAFRGIGSSLAAPMFGPAHQRVAVVTPRHAKADHCAPDQRFKQSSFYFHRVRAWHLRERMLARAKHRCRCP
jgi:hypothetical protein